MAWAATLMLASTLLILRKSRMRRRARTDLCGGDQQWSSLPRQLLSSLIGWLACLPTNHQDCHQTPCLIKGLGVEHLALSLFFGRCCKFTTFCNLLLRCDISPSFPAYSSIRWTRGASLRKRARMLKFQVRRWSERPRMLVFMLGVMLPAAALIAVGVWHLTTIKRDKAIEAVLQREFQQVFPVLHPFEMWQ